MQSKFGRKRVVGDQWRREGDMQPRAVDTAARGPVKDSAANKKNVFGFLQLPFEGAGETQVLS